MSRDLDVDILKVLVEDDASRFLERVQLVKRRPRFMLNKPPIMPSRRTDQIESYNGNIFDPTRPGFIARIKGILR